MSELVLQLLASIYGRAVRVRNGLYDSGILNSERVGVPVMSVGNIEVGGTGKTPVTIYLANFLSRRMGKRVAVLSRGYGRRSGEARVLVSSGRGPLVSADRAGDEPWLIAKKTDAIVVAGADRVEAARFVLRDFSVDVILLDDGFQHRRLSRQSDLVLVSPELKLGENRLLPAGRLREPSRSLKRASHVASLRYEEPAALEQTGAPTEIGFLCACTGGRLLGDSVRLPDFSLNGKRVGLVSGIAKPRSFRQTVEGLGAQVVATKVVEDHGHFGAGVLSRFEKRARERGAELILLTEKDEGRALLEPRLDCPKNIVVLETRTEILSGGGILKQALEGLFS